MSFDPDVVQFGILLGRPTVILHVPEMAITLLVVPVVLEEEILGQFEDDGEEDEQLADDLEMDVSREAFDLGPVSRDDGRVVARVPSGEFGNVVDLRVVADAGLDLAGPQRLVAVVPAVLEVGPVLEFLVHGEFKDLLAQTELSIDLVLAQAKIGDVEESCWCVRGFPKSVLTNVLGHCVCVCHRDSRGCTEY